MVETELTREGFAEYVANNIVSYIGDEGIIPKVQEMRKPNGSYLGVALGREGTCVAPVINIDAYFKKYTETGESLDDIMKEMAKIANTPTPASPDDMLGIIKNWDMAVGRLFVRLYATDVVPEDKLSREVADGLSIVPYVSVSMDDRGIASAAITEDIAEMWGKDREYIIDKALRNAERLMPIEIVSMAEAMGMPEDILPVPTYIVTNNKKCGGASALFYEGTFSKLEDILDTEKFTVLPSSVNEFIVIPYKAGTENKLAEVVRMINGKSVPDDLRLADCVYIYDNGELRKEV